jgi:hypothetical protein
VKKANLHEMQQTPTFGAPTALEARLNKKQDTDEEFMKAMRGGAYELFSEFEEDNASGAKTLKLQILVMIRQGFLKDEGDGTITKEQMGRMIQGVKNASAQAAANAKAQRSRRCGFDSEEDDDDSDLW